MVKQKWILDSFHSSVEFSIRHMMISTVRGKFKKFSVDIIEDTDNVELSSAKVTIDVASIDTGQDDRDNHLRSPDLFDVQKYPTIVFQSTKVSGSGESFQVDGNLTIHSTTKPISFTIERVGPINDPYGNIRYGVSMSSSINRKDFGISWNKLIEGGGLMVGETVKMEVNLELLKEKAT